MNDPRHPAQPHQPPRAAQAPPARPAAAPHTSGLPKIAPMPVLPVHHGDDEPIELEELPAAPADSTRAAPKITAFGVTNMAAQRENFKRKTNVDGCGATRLRSFHGRLSDEGLAYLDQKVNEWLDEHPEIEVKFVTSTVGPYEGKIKEPALVMNVWY